MSKYGKESGRKANKTICIFGKNGYNKKQEENPFVSDFLDMNPHLIWTISQGKENQMKEKLQTLPLTQLRELAKAQGIKSVTTLKKAELIEKLCGLSETADTQKKEEASAEPVSDSVKAAVSEPQRTAEPRREEERRTYQPREYQQREYQQKSYPSRNYQQRGDGQRTYQQRDGQRT